MHHEESKRVKEGNANVYTNGPDARWDMKETSAK
jgi:hypothetical protein